MKEKNSKINNPFRLPDNYFEEFHRNLMQQLPQKEIAHQLHNKQLRINKIRRWSYAAAIALMLIIGGATLCQFGYYKITSAIAEAENNELIETIFDSYPIDDYNVYCYLTNSDINF
jgi:hypothetical protein